MKKHTPGPWACFNRDGSRIFKQWGVQGADGKRVCWVENGPACDKDAALIAAAPEMLEACRSALPALIHLGNFVGNDFSGAIGLAPYDRCAIIGAIRAAIAKAEGGAA